MPRELSNGINLKGALQLSGNAGSSGQVLTSAGTGAVPTWAAAGGFTGGTLTSNLTVAAGTTSLSPLTFQSGTNLTTATAGAVEYDGKVIYATPNATAGRGVSPSMLFYRLNSSLAGSNVNTAQSVFGVGVTLAASTVYAFDGFFTLQKTAGTTSHTISLLFGGTATLNNVGYWASSLRYTTANANEAATAQGIAVVVGYGTSTSATVYTGSITTTNSTFTIKIQGTVSVNAGGTFIPQYQLSAAPGGAYSTLVGGSFAVWPVGASGANTSVGAWA